MYGWNYRVGINFSIAISVKNGVLNTAGRWGSCDFPLEVGPGQSHAGGPGKFDFYCSKDQRMTYYLFIFYVKFSAVLVK